MWHHKNEKEILEEILKVEREQLALLEKILRNQSRYTIRITQLTENNMALVALAPGNVAQFGVTLLLNGVPDTSGFAVAPTATSTDTFITFAPATTDASGGTIPLAAQISATDGTGDTATSAVITFTAVDPLGTTQTTTITWAAGTTPPIDGYSLSAVQLL